MNDIVKQSRRTALGLCSILAAVAGFLCWFVPYSPSIFLFGIIGLQTLSFVLAIVAAFRSSRWWFGAALLPVFLFVLIVPQYEKRTSITVKGNIPKGVVFKLSGTSTVPSFNIDVYSADMKEPGDRRFLVWQIEAADSDLGGESAWKIGEIKYGVVPAGYIQKFPEHGVPPLSLQEGGIYHVDAGGSFRRYFGIVNGNPRWLINPPKEPCFMKQNGQWIKVDCNPLRREER